VDAAGGGRGGGCLGGEVGAHVSREMGTLADEKSCEISTQLVDVGEWTVTQSAVAPKASERVVCIRPSA
jgi:hypothetical protein